MNARKQPHNEINVSNFRCNLLILCFLCTAEGRLGQNQGEHLFTFLLVYELEIPQCFIVRGVYFAGVGDGEKSPDVDFCAVSHRLQRFMLQNPFQLTRGSCTI